MKLRTIHEVDMLKRIHHFLRERPTVAAIPRIVELSTIIHTAITTTQTAARDQISGCHEAAGGTAVRREKQQELRAYLKDLARVARSLDRNAHPGLAAHFVLPESRGYQPLLAKARVMRNAAAELESTFIARGLPETFLADLTTLLDQFAAATTAKYRGLQTQIAGTSGLKFHAAQGIKAAQELDAILRAHFRKDPITLETWHHARHIQVDPKRSAEIATAASTSTAEAASTKADTTPGTSSVHAELNISSRSITGHAHPPTKTDSIILPAPPQKSHLTLQSHRTDPLTHDPHLQY